MPTSAMSSATMSKGSNKKIPHLTHSEKGQSRSSRIKNRSPPSGQKKRLSMSTSETSQEPTTKATVTTGSEPSASYKNGSDSNPTWNTIDFRNPYKELPVDSNFSKCSQGFKYLEEIAVCNRMEGLKNKNFMRFGSQQLESELGKESLFTTSDQCSTMFPPRSQGSRILTPDTGLGKRSSWSGTSNRISSDSQGKPKNETYLASDSMPSDLTRSENTSGGFNYNIKMGSPVTLSYWINQGKLPPQQEEFPIYWLARGGMPGSKDYDNNLPHPQIESIRVTENRQKRNLILWTPSKATLFFHGKNNADNVSKEPQPCSLNNRSTGDMFSEPVNQDWDETRFPVEHKLGTSEGLQHAMASVRIARERSRMVRHHSRFSLPDTAGQSHNSGSRWDLHLKYRHVMSRLRRKEYLEWESDALARSTSRGKRKEKKRSSERTRLRRAQQSKKEPSPRSGPKSSDSLTQPRRSAMSSPRLEASEQTDTRLPAIGIHPKPMSNFYPEEQLPAGERYVQVPAAFVEKTSIDVRDDLDTEQGHRAPGGSKRKEEVDGRDQRVDSGIRSSQVGRAKSEEELFKCRMKPAEQSPRYKTPPVLAEELNKRHPKSCACKACAKAAYWINSLGYSCFSVGDSKQQPSQTTTVQVMVSENTTPRQLTPSADLALATPDMRGVGVDSPAKGSVVSTDLESGDHHDPSDDEIMSSISKRK
ncbi:uncharacterized protein LOC131951086 isoform X2 [Physella acuta]|uniref:uncharacterized protein LOC131951086 isoform X2 n=1 Tax=Physella acuta TaxID=109671 RepID=UPI0027DC73CA|nr:uncharacterized protein LOC131951086 isoform X2 [Physella acuta]